MTPAALVRQIAENAPDPADAGRRAERWLEATGVRPTTLTHAAVEILALACRRAPYLATLCSRDPARLARVAADPYLRREKPAAVIAAEVDAAVAAATTPEELARALRRVRADELVRLGARELDLGLDTEVGRELAHLADACFDAAIRFHDARLRARHGVPRFRDDDGAERVAGLCVIAMGKHGGLELNFSSDVDVIYVYSSDAGELDGRSLHEYFAKLATAVTQALGDVTADDVVFRVDLRLRPEGGSGAIANSLAQVERYYETFGRPWERQAWIKARPCAGDLALGAEVMATLAPFVHPRHTAPTIIDEVMALNRRIKRELDPGAGRGAGAGGALGFDVKNGRGGIREIEFFVQALQLIHAGRDPSLRARGTLPALDSLLFAGLVGDGEHLALHRAYRWLRHVEHVLQLEGGLQTQRLPRDPGALDVVARRVGLADGAALAATLTAHTRRVAELFATLGDPGAAGPEEEAIGQLARGELGPDAERAQLAALGFADPAAAARELERARKRPWSPFAPAATGAVARVGGALLGELARSADPDAALRHVADLVGKRGASWSVWQLLDEKRALLRLLGSILGASEYLARNIVERPELIDLLVEVGVHRDRATLERDADRRLAAAHAADPGDTELAWSALAEFKNGQVLRVGLADFAGRRGALEVCADLTAIAEVCLERAFDRVAFELRDRHGVVHAADNRRGRLAVLGLGKLGGAELGYAADLDVVFVYDGDGDSDGPRPLPAVEYWTRLAQRLVGGLHARTPRGRLYEVDTRLRPSGSQGLLVSSLAGWRRYHATEARLWERQALIKLRPVAGDPTLGAEVAAEVASWLWSAPPAQPARAIAAEIVAMRDRIERELGSPSDLKVGKGGIIDAEFAAQYLQLVHGHAHPGLRTPSTAPALAAARAARVAPAHELELLEEGYRFLRLIEHRMRVVHDRPVHRLPDDPAELGRLARRCGFGTGDALRDRVVRWQHDVRAAFERVMRPGPGAP